MNSSIERYERMLVKIKKAYYLEGITLTFKIMNLPGSARARWSLLKGYYLVVDLQKTSKMNDKELIGLLAHEMAHIKQLANFSLLKKISEMVMALIAGKSNKFYLMQKNKIKFIEREADKFAIDNGFGKELLAFREWGEKNYSGEKLIALKELYLSSKEIRKELRK